MTNTNQEKQPRKSAKVQIDRIVPKLRHIPAFTETYNTIWKEASYATRKMYPDQFILVTQVKTSKGYQSPISFIDTLFEGMGSTNRYVSADSKKLLQLLMVKPIDSNGMFRFIERHEVEYNYMYKQLNVFTFIHDGEYALVLTRNSAHRPYTLPGGHVDFDKNTYSRSILDTLKKNGLKEIEEEVDLTKCKDMDLKKVRNRMRLMMYANQETDWNKTFHGAFIFEAQVDDVRKMFKGIKSGEPSKHDVAIVKISDLKLKKTNCTWLASCMDYLNRNEDKK